ncbi:MAG: hypothetical protein AB1942_12185 [Pseudomonadota bacterium]
MDDPITRELGAGTVLRQAPSITPDPQAEQDLRSQKAAILGATLSDIGASFRGGRGGSLERVQAGFRARAAQEKAQADMARINQMAADLYPDDEEAQFLFSQAPDEFVKQRLEERRPENSVVINTRLGPRLYSPKSGEYRSLEDIPERLPPGYRYNDQGEVVVDQTYVTGQGALAEARAAASAKYRAPRSGGGERPAGGTLRAASRRQPWAE